MEALIDLFKVLFCLIPDVVDASGVPRPTAAMILLVVGGWHRYWS